MPVTDRYLAALTGSSPPRPHVTGSVGSAAKDARADGTGRSTCTAATAEPVVTEETEAILIPSAATATATASSTAWDCGALPKRESPIGSPVNSSANANGAVVRSPNPSNNANTCAAGTAMDSNGRHQPARTSVAAAYLRACSPTPDIGRIRISGINSGSGIRSGSKEYDDPDLTGLPEMAPTSSSESAGSVDVTPEQSNGQGNAAFEKIWNSKEGSGADKSEKSNSPQPALAAAYPFRRSPRSPLRSRPDSSPVQRRRNGKDRTSSMSDDGPRNIPTLSSGSSGSGGASDEEEGDDNIHAGRTCRSTNNTNEAIEGKAALLSRYRPKSAPANQSESNATLPQTRLRPVPGIGSNVRKLGASFKNRLECGGASVSNVVLEEHGRVLEKMQRAERERERERQKQQDGDGGELIPPPPTTAPPGSAETREAPAAAAAAAAALSPIREKEIWRRRRKQREEQAAQYRREEAEAEAERAGGGGSAKEAGGGGGGGGPAAASAAHRRSQRSLRGGRSVPVPATGNHKSTISSRQSEVSVPASTLSMPSTEVMTNRTSDFRRNMWLNRSTNDEPGDGENPQESDAESLDSASDVAADEEVGRLAVDAEQREGGGMQAPPGRHRRSGGPGKDGRNSQTNTFAPAPGRVTPVLTLVGGAVPENDATGTTAALREKEGRMKRSGEGAVTGKQQRNSPGGQSSRELDDVLGKPPKVPPSSSRVQPRIAAAQALFGSPPAVRPHYRGAKSLVDDLVSESSVGGGGPAESEAAATASKAAAVGAAGTVGAEDYQADEADDVAEPLPTTHFSAVNYRADVSLTSSTDVELGIVEGSSVDDDGGGDLTGKSFTLNRASKNTGRKKKKNKKKEKQGGRLPSPTSIPIEAKSSEGRETANHHPSSPISPKAATTISPKATTPSQPEWMGVKLRKTARGSGSQLQGDAKHPISPREDSNDEEVTSFCNKLKKDASAAIDTIKPRLSQADQLNRNGNDSVPSASSPAAQPNCAGVSPSNSRPSTEALPSQHASGKVEKKPVVVRHSNRTNSSSAGANHGVDTTAPRNNGSFDKENELKLRKIAEDADVKISKVSPTKDRLSVLEKSRNMRRSHNILLADLSHVGSPQTDSADAETGSDRGFRGLRSRFEATDAPQGINQSEDENMQSIRSKFEEMASPRASGQEAVANARSIFEKKTARDRAPKPVHLSNNDSNSNRPNLPQVNSIRSSFEPEPKRWHAGISPTNKGYRSPRYSSRDSDLNGDSENPMKTEGTVESQPDETPIGVKNVRSIFETKGTPAVVTSAFEHISPRQDDAKAVRDSPFQSLAAPKSSLQAESRRSQPKKPTPLIQRSARDNSPPKQRRTGTGSVSPKKDINTSMEVGVHSPSPSPPRPSGRKQVDGLDLHSSLLREALRQSHKHSAVTRSKLTQSPSAYGNTPKKDRPMDFQVTDEDGVSLSPVSSTVGSAITTLSDRGSATGSPNGSVGSGGEEKGDNANWLHDNDNLNLFPQAEFEPEFVSKQKAESDPFSTPAFPTTSQEDNGAGGNENWTENFANFDSFDAFNSFGLMASGGFNPFNDSTRDDSSARDDDVDSLLKNVDRWALNASSLLSSDS